MHTLIYAAQGPAQSPNISLLSFFFNYKLSKTLSDGPTRLVAQPQWVTKFLNKNVLKRKTYSKSKEKPIDSNLLIS